MARNRKEFSITHSLHKRINIKFENKGGTSGNAMTVVEWTADCDSNAHLFKVRMQGPQVDSHTGACNSLFKKCD